MLTAAELAALEADGIFIGAAVDLADGFVHLSTAEQLTETVDKHFAGREGLHVAAVDLGSFGKSLKWEASRGNELFPHLYGPLPLDAILAYGPLERGEGGAIRLPIAG